MRQAVRATRFERESYSVLIMLIESFSERLQKRLCDPNGKRKPGAVSRLAEYLKVSYNTVRRWMDGKSLPSKALAGAIWNALGDKSLDLTGKRRGPKKKLQNRKK